MLSILKKACKKINKNSRTNSCIETVCLITLRCNPIFKAIFDKNNCIEIFSIFNNLRPREILYLDLFRTSHCILIFIDENARLYILDSYINRYKAKIFRVDKNIFKDIFNIEFNMAYDKKGKDKVNFLYKKYFRNYDAPDGLLKNIELSVIKVEKFVFDPEFFKTGYMRIHDNIFKEEFIFYRSFFES